jgi:hypothetical protein
MFVKLGALGAGAPGLAPYCDPPIPPGTVMTNDPNVTELNPPSGAFVFFTVVATPPAPTTMVRVCPGVTARPVKNPAEPPDPPPPPPSPVFPSSPAPPPPTANADNVDTFAGTVNVYVPGVM